MNIRKFSTFAVGCCVSLIPISAFAWGPVGHRVVGIIAQDRLTPQAFSAVQAILGKNSQGQNVSLQDVANCPDDLKYSKAAYTCADDFTMTAGEVTVFGTIAMPWKASSPWHFIDIPNNVIPTVADVEQYCPNNHDSQALDCSTEQIKYDIQVLESPQASLQDKQIALMFLVHFVGDEHQPLHDNDDNDFGGNKKKVVFEGHSMNLHALWDDIIEPNYDYDTETAQQERGNATQLAAQLEQDLGNQDVSSWTAGNDLPDQAAVEGALIAENVIRPAYAQAYAAGKNAAVFTTDYKFVMQPIAYEQLEKGGVRLAYILNQVFAQNQTSSASKKDFFSRLGRWLGVNGNSVPWDGTK